MEIIEKAIERKDIPIVRATRALTR